MTNLNANELTILKACLDNAQDAAGGDFGFSDEIHGYVKDDFSQHQVSGYLSQLTDKGLIWLDHCRTDTFDGNQITFPKATIVVAMQAGLLSESEAKGFQCYYDDDLNGDPSDFDFERPAQEEPEATPEATMTYGQVNRAYRAAVDAEEDAASWLNMAKFSCGKPNFDANSEHYRIAAQLAVKARLEWLEIRNNFECGFKLINKSGK